MSNRLGTNGADEGISLKELILQMRELSHYIVARFKWLVIAFVLGGGIAAFVVWPKEPVYIAKSTFVLSEEGISGAGSGIASLIGIAGVGNRNAGLFQGENLFALYQSRLMLQKTLLTEIDLNSRKQLLVDRYIEMNGLREEWDENPRLRNIKFSGPNLSTIHDSILSGIVSRIRNKSLKVGRDENSSLISIEFRSPDQFFSKAFNDVLVENVNNFYIQTQTKRSLDNLRVLQKQADSIKAVLNSSISGSAASIDANPNANPALQILRVPTQRRQIDIQTNSAIYSEVIKNLEITRMALRKESPLIQLVDRPVLPLSKEVPNKKLWVIIGGLLSSFLLTVYIIMSYLIKRILS